MSRILRWSVRGIEAAQRQPATEKGFTLVEVLIALGIFLGAMMAILGIYFQNLTLARMAREEVVVSMIQRDIMARNAVVASARAGHERWARRTSTALPPEFETFGSPRDGTDYAGSAPGEQSDPDLALSAGWGVRNINTWESASDHTLHWGRSQPALDTDVALYENFYFTVHPVWRFPNQTDGDGDGFPDYPWLRRNFEPSDEDEWDISQTSGLPGLAREDSQYTDWDGYGLVDLDRDGIPETDRGWPAASPGPILPAGAGLSIGGSTGYAGNPFRIFYNSDKMRHYFLRLRVRIMWQVKDEAHVYNLTDKKLKEDFEDNNIRIFNHTEYYFSVFNPDIVKRWHPKP